MALTFKLELARFLTLLRFQDRAVCGKGTELQGGTSHISNLGQHCTLEQGTKGEYTAHKNFITCSHWGGDTAQNSKPSPIEIL